MKKKNIELSVGEVTVRELPSYEGRQISLELVLIKEEDLDVSSKAEKINRLYFKKMSMSSGLDMKTLKRLKEEEIVLLEKAIKEVNSLSDLEVSDLS